MAMKKKHKNPGHRMYNDQHKCGGSGKESDPSTNLLYYYLEWRMKKFLLASWSGKEELFSKKENKKKENGRKINR